jgi:ATP-dependent DNA helicase RecG
MLLGELRQKLQEVKGIGPKTRTILHRGGIHNVADLLRHFPRGWEDRKTPVPLGAIPGGGTANTLIRVVGHDYFGWGPKKTLKIIIQDLQDGTPATLVCFNRNFLADKLKPGTEHLLYGTFLYRFGELQSTSFETEGAVADRGADFNRILPLYPLWGGLTMGALRKMEESALNLFGRHVEEELPETIRRKRRLLPFPRALSSIHFPSTLEEAAAAEKTLKYHELFLLQLTVGRRAWERRSLTREPRPVPGRLMEKLKFGLGFPLTADQQTVLETIRDEMASGRPMARLLQGDVGSGKTLVAFFAALLAIERGDQVAFMAPTEVLARQHGENAARYLEPLGIRLGFLTGSLKDKSRRYLLEALAAGEIDLVLGTHALFTGDVTFPSLGLAIVDEQHRFGVVQRSALRRKGQAPDLLLMTATPIPRTLTMTALGDLDVSTIKTMPPGRQPVETHLARQDNAEKVYRWVRRELEAGRQAYFVYPLIEESEKLNLENAEAAFRLLSEEIFQDRTAALLHSRIPEEQKRETMSRFTAGEIDILVATSVIEVGVDVPNATCMVIGNAERFGLSALHQLRGRVGRGSHRSACFLLYGPDLSEDGKARLKVMKEQSDGFLIAEEDLRLRGPGDLAGKLQSGFLSFRIADITRDFDLLKDAREDAFALIEDDPGLIRQENQPLREVFQRTPPYPDHLLEDG